MGGGKCKREITKRKENLKYQLEAFIPLRQQPQDPLESRKGFCNRHYAVAHMLREICLMNVV